MFSQFTDKSGEQLGRLSGNYTEFAMTSTTNVVNIHYFAVTNDKVYDEPKYPEFTGRWESVPCNGIYHILAHLVIRGRLTRCWNVQVFCLQE